MSPQVVSQPPIKYQYIKVFEPLPWQVAPWRDKSPIMLLSGSAGGGKALDIRTPVLTLDGWKDMGTVGVGDIVFDESGQPCQVTAATEVMYDRPCYEIELSSGEIFIADAEHQWFTSTIKERYAWKENLRRDVNPDRLYGDVRTTTQILEDTLKQDRSEHAIRVANPINPPRSEPLFIPSYVLGAWLGDGHSQNGCITTHEDDFFIIEQILNYGYGYSGRTGKYTHKIVGLGFQLEEAGLLFNKHIPEEYFLASYEDRLALLQGLLDTDGSIDVKGRVEICQTNERLIRDIHRLISSLGIRASVIQNRAGYKGYKENSAGYFVDCGIRHRISFYTNEPVFRLPRKLERCVAETTERTQWRYITDVREVESVPVRCIQVDSPSSLFLAGDTLVPTHNSRFCAEKLHALCLKYPGTTALVLRKIRATIGNSTLPFMKRNVIGQDPRVKYVASQFRFEYQNGSMLVFGGMKDDDQRERIRSIGQDGGLDFVWMEEAVEFDEEDFNEVIARMRGRAAEWTQIMLSTNPDAPGHWINIRLIMGEGASCHFSGAIDNPYNPADYVDRTLKKLTGVQYRRLVLGEWTVGSGLIMDTWLDRYSRETGDDGGGNVTEKAEYIPDGGPVVWTIDDGYSGKMDTKTRMFTGKSHPRAILLCQIRADGQLAVFGEHLAIEKLAPDHIYAVQAMCRERGWPDKPAYAVRDRAAASLEGVLKEFGIRSHYNQVPVDESIKEMRQWLAADDNGYRRLIVHPRCFYTRYQMASYSYDNNGGIIKEHDDSIDSIRYIIFHLSFGRSGRVDVATYSSHLITEYNYNGY